jgi:hypothetical protein
MRNVIERTKVYRNDALAFASNVLKTYVLSKSNFVSYVNQSKNRKLVFEHAALLERWDCAGHDELILDRIKKLDDGGNRADCISFVNGIIQIVLRQGVIDNCNVNHNSTSCWLLCVVSKPESDGSCVL